ncbi:5108_t:CDS:10 [Ambispora gerdemannii]|uniref:5108_t:CDS:1 n=1 Tax=Ambispora gerdemannii TaxID=144530 RepID=A0A9N8ZMU1_9GLOM|nr:5108_t:CDS:10 [Ambispora gerdemannii]
MDASTSSTPAKSSKKRGRPRKISQSPSPPAEPLSPKAQQRTPDSSSSNPDTSRLDLEESGQTLFEAIRDPNSALETITSDWVETYETNKQTALLVLVNFIIKSAGCPESINADSFEDEDHIVDNLKALQDAYEKESISDYPLVSKSKDFKKFRKNLLEFFHRLIKQIKHSILYDEVFFETVASWVIAMSSSVFRPFRHTATTITHAIVSSLCDAAQEALTELNIAHRQLNAEQKKSRGTRNARYSSLEAKTTELNDKKEHLHSYLNEFFDCVFVHRYRDVEALIRAECIKELGLWISKYPELFLDDTYLRYIGWQLSDKSPLVRIESVKSLSRLYAKETFKTSLRHFTERFKSRILEMGLMESDITVRISSINLLAQISQAELLEDSDGYEDQISLLIYSDNPKVRKAVTPFVRDILNIEYIQKKVEEVETAALNGINGSSGITNIRKDWITFKCLAEFLVKSSKAIKRATNSTENNNDDETMLIMDIEESEESDEDIEIAQKIGGGKKSRVILAIQDLFNELQALKDWKTLADYLTKDHSLTSNNLTSSGSTVAPSSSSTTTSDPANIVEDCYRLNEQEETVLVEVLIASINLSLEEPLKAKDKKDVEVRQDEISAEIARTMVKVLPRLLTKYAPDAGRIAEVLQIPPLMKLDVYQDLRMSKAYETLVDDVKELFLKHTQPSVLANAAETFRHMANTKILASITETKLGELQEEVVQAFKQEYDAKELSFRPLSSDQVHSINASLNRMEQLISFINIVPAVEEKDENGTDVFDCISAVAQRGMLPNKKSDEKIIISAINFIWFYIMWKVNTLTLNEDEIQDAQAQVVDDFLTRRDKVVNILEGLVTSGDAVNSARKMAYKTLGNIYWLFACDFFYLPNCPNIAKLRLSCPNSTQETLVAFVENEIIKHKQEIVESIKQVRSKLHNERDENDNEEENNNNEEDEENSKRLKNTDNYLTAYQKHEFLDIIGALLRGARGGIFDIKFSATVIAQYGKFGSDVDDLIKKVIQEFKDWKYETEPQAFYEICSDSLLKIFEMYEHIVDQEPNDTSESLQTTIMESASALARIFANTLHLRETSTVQSRKDSDHIVEMHMRLFEHAIENMAGFEHGMKNLKMLKYWIKFFKPLTALLGGVSINDALTIDAKLKTSLEANLVKVPAEHDKDWEAYYGYVQKIHKILVKFGVRSPVINEESSKRSATAAGISSGARRKRKPATTKKNNKTKNNDENANIREKTPKNSKKRTSSSVDVDEDEFVGALTSNGGAAHPPQRKKLRKQSSPPTTTKKTATTRNKHKSPEISLSNVYITRSGRRSKKVHRR